MLVWSKELKKYQRDVLKILIEQEILKNDVQDGSKDKPIYVNG